MSNSDHRSEVNSASQPVSLKAIRDTPRYTYLIAAIAAIGGMLFG